jgi:hypothetical protein
MTFPAIPISFGMVVMPVLAVFLAVAAITVIALTALVDWLSPEQGGPEREPEDKADRNDPQDLNRAATG